MGRVKSKELVEKNNTPIKTATTLHVKNKPFNNKKR
jgi:hypothetical protein